MSDACREGGVMGVLIDGKWKDGELPQETSQTGQFKRVDSVFRDRITADGSSGFKAEPGRYHLYVAHGCPWAHRTLIYRASRSSRGSFPSPIRSPVSSRTAGRLNATRVIRIAFPTRSTAFTICTKPMWRAIRPIPARSRSRHCGTRRSESSTTSRPRSSGCSIRNSTRSPATARIFIRRPCGQRSTPSTSASITTSTTACTAQASRNPKPPTRKPTTAC